MMINLLWNAVKFNRVGGSVAVSCEIMDERIYIKVTDTGRGISAANLPRLFVHFERLDEVTRSPKAATSGSRFPSISLKH